MFAGIGLWHWAQLGRQAAWRPRCIFNGVVWLVASCWQMLIVFAWIGLWHWAQLGRQAAWRPRCILNGVVWLVASCWKMLISVCWDWALALGSTRSSSCLATEVQNRQAAWRKKFSCWLSGWVRCYHCVIKLLGGIRRCRAARHRQGLGGMLEAMNTGVRSSCLAGTLVALGQAVWRPGDIGVVSSNRLAARCKQYLFRSGLGGLVRPDPVTWRRLGLRRSRTTHQDKMCRSSQDTSFLRFSVMTHMTRHIVVAPIPSAPLLTDTRRSTVGPGMREDIACVVGGVRRTCPSSCCVRSAVLVVGVFQVRWSE